jgi:hypothetical protein
MIRPRVNVTFTFHVTQNTVRLSYKNQPVTAAQDSNQCFLYVVRNVTNALLHCVRECQVTSDASLYTDVKLQTVKWTGISYGGIATRYGLDYLGIEFRSGE